MIIVNNIKLHIDDDKNSALLNAMKLLKINNSDVKNIFLRKISTDARKGDVKFVCSVAIELVDERKEALFLNKSSDIVVKPRTKIEFIKGSEELSLPPVVCGFGPSGIFAALTLARQGFKPIVIEQGSDIDTRQKKVDEFYKNKTLDTKSNVQFGEGGAGTFSDGKLTTRINDENCEFVIDTFIKHNAPKEIRYKAKPHIGTDLLTQVIKSIREEIISLGATVLFDTKLIDIKTKNSKVSSVITDKGEINTDLLILATGHSARDIFSLLKEKEVTMNAKPFSVGVRIEHLQEDINKSLYHNLHNHKNLDKGEYQLAHTKQDRGVYTFCMCPGGSVVAAMSEEDTVVVNGMSKHARDNTNANSAVVVSILPEDFNNDYEKAIQFQKTLEKNAFIFGGKDYKAPIQTMDNFLIGKAGANIKSVKPSYPLGVTESDFNKILPSVVVDNLKIALPQMNKKLTGFTKSDAVLTAVETRTSSPVRILRDEEYTSNLKGLMPTGEGAGYAGGIMSSAVDGVRVARFIIKKYKPKY